MSGAFGGLIDTEKNKTVALTLNLAQAAATYDAGTVSGGSIMLLEAVAYVSVVGATFDSVSIQTNNTTAVEILSAAEGAVANITADKNLKVFTTKTVIPSGKKIQFTIVGSTGTGTIILYVRYQPLANGAVLA